MKTLVTLALGLAATAVCSAGDMKIKQALRDLDDQWSKAAGAKDLEKTVSYYAEGAIVMPPNAPGAKTKEAIRSAWKELLATPGAANTSRFGKNRPTANGSA